MFAAKALSALPLPVHLSDTLWSGAPKKGFRHTHIDISIDKTSPQHGYYYAQTAYLNGSNTFNEQPNVLYAGIVNRGYNGKEWVGKMAIFSVWGVHSGMIEDNGWGTHFSHEGTGYSVRIPYEWQAGRTYRLEIKIIGRRSINHIFAAYLTDLSSGIKTRIGRIAIPRNRGVMKQLIAFHELFSFMQQTPETCEELSSSVVTFHNAVADGMLLSPKPYHVNTYPSCPGFNRVQPWQNGIKSIFEKP